MFCATTPSEHIVVNRKQPNHAAWDGAALFVQHLEIFEVGPDSPVILLEP